MSHSFLCEILGHFLSFTILLTSLFFNFGRVSVNNFLSCQMEDLEALAESVAASMLYLTLECGQTPDRAADHAASHLGKVIQSSFS